MVLAAIEVVVACPPCEDGGVSVPAASEDDAPEPPEAPSVDASASAGLLAPLAGIPASWGLPYWAQRQTDPTSPGFLTAGGAPDPAGAATGWMPTNRTQRDWVVLGTLGRPLRSVVDPRGLVTPAPGSWSLDWWVGGEDRWHLPSRELTVRQRLVDDAPVVETAMRVHGGDIVHRAYAAVGDDGEPWLVVEVENRTAAAVALAMAVRPWGPLGACGVGSVAVEDSWLVVDGAPAVALPRPPWRAYVADGDGDPVVAQVLAGGEGVAEPRCSSRAGRAEAAVVLPLPHTLTARFALPLAGGSRRGRRTSPTVPAAPSLPAGAEVAAGWSSVAARGPRLELPDPALTSAVAAARRHLLGVPAGEDLLWWEGGAVDLTSWAPVLEALAVWGGVEEAAGVLSSWEERQALDGRFLGNDRRRDATGAALVALGRHLRITADTDQLGVWAPVAAKAASWIDRRATSRRHRADPATLGLLPEGDQPWWVGPPGVAYRDSWWALGGLDEAVGILAAAGEDEAAAATAAAADRLRETLAASIAVDASTLGSDVVPVGPGRRLDPGIVALIDAVVVGAVAPTSTATSATLDAIRHGLVDPDGAVVLHAPALGAAPVGRSPALTARLARVELARGEASALNRLRWLATSATGAMTWPEVVHPRTGGGAVGTGHDPVATAEVLLAVRDLLVLVSPSGDDVALTPVLPTSWLGQPWEVHDLLTPAGRLGYAVRWHGDRPALLWELDPHPGSAPATIRAPGLDPAWSSTERSGEALLGPVAAPDAADGASTSSADEADGPDRPDRPDGPDGGGPLGPGEGFT